MIVVSAAIRWHGDSLRVSSVLAAGAVTAVVNVSLSLLAAVVLWVSPVAIILLGMVTLVTALAYRRFAGLHQRYASLQLLYDFTKVVGSSVRAEAAMHEVLGEAANFCEPSG